MHFLKKNLVIDVVPWWRCCATAADKPGNRFSQCVKYYKYYLDSFVKCEDSAQLKCEVCVQVKVSVYLHWGQLEFTLPERWD